MGLEGHALETAGDIMSATRCIQAASADAIRHA